jgi:hypothetical protein
MEERVPEGRERRSVLPKRVLRDAGRRDRTRTNTLVDRRRAQARAVKFHSDGGRTAWNSSCSFASSQQTGGKKVLPPPNGGGRRI